MATPVLIIGKSGTGKSASMRNCIGKDFNLIRVLNKPLPFKGKINGWQSDNYEDIVKMLSQSKAKSIVIDDAGYLIVNQFMRGHSSYNKGNAIFGFYNDLADRFWGLIDFITKMPDDKIVYLIMHEDTNDFGDIRPRTIGKLLDEKVCIEGLCTLAFRAIKEGDDYLFVTQSKGGAISKTPIGMFSDLTIDNDLAMVDEKIREYYNNEGEEENEEN